MNKKQFKRVFILGAGSNACYEFPTGFELRQSIINQVIQGLNKVDFEHYDRFRTSFRESGIQSIDRFLEINDHYQDVGKKVIAWFVSRQEKSEYLTNNVEDNWYFYLFNRFMQEVDQLKSGEISFITFNYDRSLEHFLFQSLSNTFPVMTHDFSAEEVLIQREKLMNYINLFSIKHVYGQLGKLLPYEDSIRKYSPPTRFSNVSNFYNGIHLLGDRDSEDNLEEIVSIVREADVIYCIGFGFDAINIERIGLTDNGLNCKAIFCTSVGLGLAERIYISNKIQGSARSKLKWYSPKKSITEFLKDLYITDGSIVDTLLQYDLHS